MIEQLVIEGITASVRAGDTGGYTKADIAGDLAAVERRIEWMAADRGDWSTRLAEYMACANELRALLADPEYRP